MIVEILDVFNNRILKAEIVPAESTSMPQKRNGWNFNWKKLLKNENTKTVMLRLVETPQTIEGVLQLKNYGNMLIMDVIEIAPHNIGPHKKYEHVAGCLIAYACRESFKTEGNYRGYLTFVSKTNLIKWYTSKYGAKLAIGQKMYIDPDKGSELIDKYLNKLN
ncbi:MAG: hypothetical protein K2Q21_10230 [Chitinophagaceae bacterium]|nr:hypothetical protein [Chitinophagaceae bacterium]